MTLPARPDQDAPIPPPAEAWFTPTVWIIAGCALILVYAGALAVLRPGG